MERHYSLSEEEKEQSLTLYDAMLQLNAYRPFQILMSYLKDDALKALNDLKDIDPHDWKEIQKKQNEIQRYEDMIDHISDLINIGEAVKLEKDQEFRGDPL